MKNLIYLLSSFSIIIFLSCSNDDPDIVNIQVGLENEISYNNLLIKINESFINDFGVSDITPNHYNYDFVLKGKLKDKTYLFYSSLYSPKVENESMFSTGKFIFSGSSPSNSIFYIERAYIAENGILIDANQGEIIINKAEENIFTIQANLTLVNNAKLKIEFTGVFTIN